MSDASIRGSASASSTSATSASLDPLLRRGPFLAVLLQGLPLAIGLASHAVINLVDLAMIGRLGDEAVQSAHVATTWNFLPMLLGQCVSTALLAQLSRDLGADGGNGVHRDVGLAGVGTARARERNRRAQWWMLWLSLAVGGATSLPAALQVDITGVRGVVRSDAIHYLVVTNLGCIPMFLLMQSTAAMRAVGEAWVPLALLLGTNVVNLGLDYVLLFGLESPALSIPSVGVVGAAYASVAARVLGCVFAFAWLARRPHPLSLRAQPDAASVVAQDAAGNPAALQAVGASLLRDAWPQAVQIGLRAALVVALTVLVQQRFGDDATVSLGITTRLDTLVLFSSLGFANAATAYAGRAAVAKRVAAARWAGGFAALQAMLFGALLVWLYQSKGDAVVGWFLPQPSAEVLQLTTLYFGVAAWSQVVGAGGLAAMGAVYGGGWMRAPMLVDVGCFAAAGLLLWRAVDGSLRDTYVALCQGMALVLLGQLVLVAVGSWARRPAV
ncbi:MAG: MATE family efflux transporter [Planctomycetota bacterium]